MRGHRVLSFVGIIALGACAGSGCAHSANPPEVIAPSLRIDPRATHVEATPTGFALTGRFEFAFNQATLSPADEGLLAEVAGVLKDNPELLEVYLPGFASSEGDPRWNERLSMKRADAVKAWLVAHGIAGWRLRAEGIGIAHPVGDNAVRAGREMNRRVEFIALKYVANGQIVEGNAPAILRAAR